MQVCLECLTGQKIRNLDTVTGLELQVVKGVLWDVDGCVEGLVGEVGNY